MEPLKFINYLADKCWSYPCTKLLGSLLTQYPHQNRTPQRPRPIMDGNSLKLTLQKWRTIQNNIPPILLPTLIWNNPHITMRMVDSNWHFVGWWAHVVSIIHLLTNWWMSNIIGNPWRSDPHLLVKIFHWVGLSIQLC